MNAGNAALVTNYTYVPGGYGTGSTSPLVQTISQPTGNLIYGYDANGNIVYVSNGSQAVAYAYDAIGPLIRVNDPFDPTAGSSGTTWEYAYDLGGNILSKTAYAFTMGLVGAPVQTDTYAYTDPNWKDKLTAYNGVPITYDAIGNPLNDGTWSYTWEHGRQLQSMSRGNEAVSFLYNEDGLRVQKTATSTGTTEYTLHGKNIVHLTRGSDFMHFFYDAQNKPAMVAYNGLLYSYAYNLQGDVIAMLNANGTVVVEYKYDAWGKSLGTTGTLATTLGTLNPFRYRGYVYDEETGLYYLRSRYYNPTWGRFVSTDSVFNANTLAENIYTYCANHPIGCIDESGHNWFDNVCNSISNVLEWVFPGNRQRATKILSGNATIGDILDWLTMGYTGTVYRATHPNKPLSLQHWSDSFAAVTVPFGAFRTLVHKAPPTVMWPVQEFNPLTGTQYSEKVLRQMEMDKYHGFPALIDTLATYSNAAPLIGGDGVRYTLVRIPGFMNNVEGFFEYIIGPNGIINHRFFNTP